MFNFDKRDKDLLFVLLATFIFTEIIDTLFDQFLGRSALHSVIQLLLFVVLFFVVIKVFFVYSKKKTDALIPDELMSILRFIRVEEQKGVLVNQVKLMKRLHVTKPTIKKRLNLLTDLGYIYFENHGNNKYIKLTKLGSNVS
mgnify:CR=1 FL=1